MVETARDAWITGIGLVSCLGEGPEAHWHGLNAAPPAPNGTLFPPYFVHTLAPIDFDTQIPKKGDQRQMEPWQRIGTYAAGLALDSAGIKGHPEILSRTDMIVCAGGGERDLAVDAAIMAGLTKTDSPEAFLNERLMSDLRPTLFLAQLSNLLAGNISIVHGVTGSSRTFMGEEASGIDAVRVALSRIAAGQSQIALVGGSFNGERPDLLLLNEIGHCNLRGQFAPVWQRGPEGGYVLGSIGAFLVIEQRSHALARGAKPVARLGAVMSDRSPRRNRDTSGALTRMHAQISGRLAAGSWAFISGTSGVEPATSAERAFLAQHPDIAVRATTTHVGHSFEPQFPMNVAIAAVAISHGRLFGPSDSSGAERPMNGALRQAVVTGVGHWRGEGMALVEAVNQGGQP